MSKLSSILPTQKIEYSDGTNWYSLATENYVNMVAKLPVTAATTGSNLIATYSNGTAGSGATLTNSGAQIALVIDGVSLSLGQRVLVKDQTSQFQNGIYTVTNVGATGSANWVLTRATDYDSIYLMVQGCTINVAQGTINANISWVQTSAQPTAIGTSPLIYAAVPNINDLEGTTNQIALSTDSSTGKTQIAIATNPTIPAGTGTGSGTNLYQFMGIPVGPTAGRPTGTYLVAGLLRMNNGS